MRENKRYLLLQGITLKENIETALLDFLGINGYSNVGLHFVERGENWIIIAVNREMLNDVRAAFALSAERIMVNMVSGTLNGLRKTHS